MCNDVTCVTWLFHAQSRVIAPFDSFKYTCSCLSYSISLTHSCITFITSIVSTKYNTTMRHFYLFAVTFSLWVWPIFVTQFALHMADPCIRPIESNPACLYTVLSYTFFFKIDYCNSLHSSHMLPNLIVSNLSWILLPVLTIKLLNFITSLLFAIHWFSVNERIHYNILSHTHKALQYNPFLNFLSSPFSSLTSSYSLIIQNV